MGSYELICVGCGVAGQHAAARAAAAGRRVAIIERSAAPGSTLAKAGAPPSRSIRETALLLAAHRDHSIEGINMRVPAGLSIAQFVARCLQAQTNAPIRINDELEQSGADTYQGDVQFIDEHTIELARAGGRVDRLIGEHILLATGSAPHHHSGVDFSNPCIVDADEMLKLPSIPADLTVFGAGMIGCEYACILAEIGVRVRLLDPHDHLMPGLDPDLRRVLVRSMLEAGVDLQLGADLRDVEPARGGGVSVQIERGAVYHTDVLMYASGRRGATSSLNLQQIGVETDKYGYIIVDDQGRTAIPHIYAAGDVTGHPSLAGEALSQAGAAVDQMFSLTPRRVNEDLLPMCLCTIPPIAMVGMTEAQARQQNINVMVGRAGLTPCRDRRTFGDEKGFMKLIFEYPSRRLLGAAIIGAEAPEIIHIAQAVIAHDGTFDYFIDAGFNTPTFSAAYQRAALDCAMAVARREAESRAA
ncbi:MAG: FAD-dependent oxidoreductase [Phycisphaerales bacterium]|nr:FAD-dependent oxidoreductase [Phycisphaerales bacterium]